MFWGQVFILHSRKRQNASSRGVSTSLTGYSSLNKPSEYCPQQGVPQNTSGHLLQDTARTPCMQKISSREIRFAFRKSLSVLFHLLHYFLHHFILPPLGSVIALAFRVPSLTPYEQTWLMQKRNVAQKWHKVLSGTSRPKCQAIANREERTHLVISCLGIAPTCRY